VNKPWWAVKAKEMQDLPNGGKSLLCFQLMFVNKTVFYIIDLTVPFIHHCTLVAVNIGLQSRI